MKEIVSLLEQDQIDFADYKRPEVIMVLRRKFRTQKDWIITSFNQYQFTEEESQKVQQAILNGDLRITDLLNRPFSHYFWSFLTFKWGEILSGGKRLSKQEVLQIATCSSNGQEFARTPIQNGNRLIKGVPLVIGKVVTSMALCMVFCLGLLSTLGAPFGLSLGLAIVLSLCNGIVCLLSRGKAMLDSAGFQPQKQKTFKTLEENIKEKTILDRGQKLFFGIVTLLACISAGISGYAGLVGLLTFLGAGMLISNPLVLILTIGLSVVAAVSFYSFQAVGIRENYTKFKNLFIEDYQKPYGLLRCVLLGMVSTVFLAVYATLTWFTTVSGVNKLFNALGATPDTLLAHFIAMICTSTTMVVNTFSQVYKVFNPKTYVDLKEKFESIYQPPEENLTRAQKIKHGAINMLKLFALIGDSLAYSVAGGIRSGIHIGETLGETIGAKFALTVTMAILSPVILVFVSIAFTWPTVFDRKKSTPCPSQMEKPLIEKISQSHTSDALQNNTLLPTSEKSPKPNDSNIRQAGLRFFDARLSEECILESNSSPTLESRTVLISSSP
ncbi:TPA: lpg2552 family Dot/Icm T4SS effector [Legionella pneumophila]|uniref:lpg2552 family Dot/Icm T4SS effector n=1 Tax=Legionella pneumophila TaxID=446 RepID=UPI000789A134|nr:lpg2552 family Dot/Icm T4SS effector [Legionella pneumophila]HAU1191080.1 lpg2552 family Dot/Icm T4SS effector [Legionella pneumophila]HBD7102528.1 lpg2552 family Dot/Icm T4SS effector [Legionella pneumophila]HCO4739031.1 lpg2552 family Dot/Icm T4SS effector [Legionella pneumophila]HDU7930995.1 lpg2552 family Dot/Icm T4SS effector [Legionella pneumophila]HDU7937064.1 lpg2552 family Dot/Icm T4SS effector [Legionella pneumophila]